MHGCTFPAPPLSPSGGSGACPRPDNSCPPDVNHSALQATAQAWTPDLSGLASAPPNARKGGASCRPVCVCVCVFWPHPASRPRMQMRRCWYLAVALPGREAQNEGGQLMLLLQEVGRGSARGRYEARAPAREAVILWAGNQALSTARAPPLRGGVCLFAFFLFRSPPPPALGLKGPPPSLKGQRPSPP